jgi:hypothetical protein
MESEGSLPYSQQLATDPILGQMNPATPSLFKQNMWLK